MELYLVHAAVGHQAFNVQQYIRLCGKRQSRWSEFVI